MIQKIKIKKLFPDVKLPVKGSENAAAFDVYAYGIYNSFLAEVNEESLRFKVPDGSVVVRLGFAAEIPKGYCVDIRPRSNLVKTKWYIPNSPGLIDSDYRGEWFIFFRPADQAQVVFPYKEGERIAQIQLKTVMDCEFEEVNELSETERGEGGFGSTGNK